MGRVINRWDPAIQIDDFPTTGLSGTSNSLAYRVHTIETHNHSPETWYGKAAAPTGTVWADDDTLTPFTCISGAGVYGVDPGDEAQVIGSADTPYAAGSVYFDLHRIVVDDVSENTIYRIRVIWGTGTIADAITAGQFSVVMGKWSNANPVETAFVPINFQMPRVAVGTKIWAQCANATNNATISFFVGFHEYEG